MRQAPTTIDPLIIEFVKIVGATSEAFRRIESAPWIEILEEQLPKRFPASFRSLVTHYAFPPFEAGELFFFANNGDNSPDDLGRAIFNDRFIAETTLKNGYLQFARPAGGSYDPICFDARRAVSNREFPIVRLDHEAILCRERIRLVATVADSFYRFVADIVSRSQDRH